MKTKVIGLILVVVLGGAQLWSQKWEHAAVLLSDVSRGETDLVVEFIRPVGVDRTILLESRDGSAKETYTVKHVYENHILLKEKLKSDFVAGSRVFR